MIHLTKIDFSAIQMLSDVWLIKNDFFESSLICKAVKENTCLSIGYCEICGKPYK